MSYKRLHSDASIPEGCLAWMRWWTDSNRADDTTYGEPLSILASIGYSTYRFQSYVMLPEALSCSYVQGSDQ